MIAMIGGIPVACSPILDHRGNLPAKETLDAVVIGASSRADVQRLLGTPTSVGAFNDKVWYYISRTQETVAFFKPTVTDQRITAVYFDDAGLVAELKQTGPEAMIKIDPESETTPTAGHSIGFFENLFGPIGRYSSKDGIYKAPPPRR